MGSNSCLTSALWGGSSDELRGDKRGQSSRVLFVPAGGPVCPCCPCSLVPPSPFPAQGIGICGRAEPLGAGGCALPLDVTVAVWHRELRIPWAIPGEKEPSWSHRSRCSGVLFFKASIQGLRDPWSFISSSERDARLIAAAFRSQERAEDSLF